MKKDLSEKKFSSHLTWGQDDSGLTLIELLVVIIILGILASIAIVGVSTARGNAVERACQTDAVNLRQALDQYFIDNAGQFPQVGSASSTSRYIKANLERYLTATPSPSPAPSPLYTPSGGLKTYIRSLPPLVGDPAGRDYYLQVNLTVPASSTAVTSVDSIQGYTTTTGSAGATASPATSAVIAACFVP